MLLALASALAVHAAQPEARAIEAAQREIEALWQSGSHMIMRTATPGRRDALRRQIVSVRHPRHCLGEIEVRFLEHPVGALYGSPQRFDWSELATSGSARDNRVTFTRRDPPLPIVNGRPVPTPRVPRPSEYFEAPDAASAARLAAAVRTLVRYCRPY